MAFSTRLPGALTVLLCLLCFRNGVRAENKPLPGFGDTIQVLGGMQRTDQDFQDGLALDILSPKPRTLVVTQNKAPLAALYMTGATGGPFVAVSNYSYIIKMNETANDLIAKIEVPYNPVTLHQQDLLEANTYVATMAADRKSWTVDDSMRNVHRSENNTRIVKMTSLEGEYILVARKSVDTSNVFVQYGQGAMRTVNMTAGVGKQSAEFIDGMRFTVQTKVDLKMNVEIREGVNPGTLPPNTASLNSFMWIVNTSKPMEKIDAEMLVPFNRMMLAAMKPDGSSPSTMLMVARRPLNATSGTFLPFNQDSQYVRELPQDKVVLPQVSQLDGQYVLLVTQPKPVGETTPRAGSNKPGRRNVERRSQARKRNSLDTRYRSP
ncbi:uncharacterized protein RAG0_07538 [Rhynchosporium agropyri]|uniref:Uncharacterized protein n=1 Tax=Rhynchosporium agropyri TaxID=914238 RepID=A0A1E1KM14_9HELO|nr:uncharacterized protein RAG0_07538 [Rhynchosporium agropyri]